MRAKPRAKEGASIVIALILLIVFLLVGISVLTASEASVQSTAALRENKQLYYYARSTALAVTENLTDVQNDALANTLVKMVEAEPERREYTCDLSADGMPADFLKEDGSGSLNAEPLQITLKGVRFDENGGLRSVDRLTVAYCFYYREQIYKMTADYSYRRPENEEKTGWTLTKYNQA